MKTPIEKELLAKLVFWVNQAELANKWYGTYDRQIRAFAVSDTEIQKKKISDKRDQRQHELVTALNRIDEIIVLIKQQYEFSTEPA
jgi:hypothetical protein